ncbi:MAG: regulatory protein RecX [Oscillospiraceae bacterium]|nr:regulatory protein RecX [Oscillospiraceae bacterium]
MIVSAIKQTSPGRLTVCFDEGEDVPSTLGVVTDWRLFAGRELDGKEVERLRLDSHRALCRERALTLLGQRPMSRRELETKLRQKGVDDETAAWCVTWLQDNRLIDEESYAAAIVRHYGAKGYGEGRARQELQRRGIPRELWEDALAARPEDTTKLDRFISQRLRDPDDRDEVRRVTAALYRRGFSREEIRDALERFHAEYIEE